jgi:hypothetical protein
MAAVKFGDARSFRSPGYFLILMVCVAASLFAKPGAAASDTWIVVEGSGTATHWSASGRTAALKTGDIIAAGDSVETGPDGRCVLQRRSYKDTVTVSPGSRFMIPAPGAKGMVADIVESMGTLLFNVEHTPGRRFEVDGPYLAAVVKGTSFSVVVTSSEGTVNVLQGAVEVRSTGSHQVVLLGAGQFAKVSAFGRHEITSGARQSSAVPLPGGARVFTPGNSQQSSQQLRETVGETRLDVGALTNNLVIGAGTRVSSPGNVSPASTSAIPAVGISSVSQNSVARTGQPSPGGSPTANISPASAGAIPAVGGISSVGQGSFAQIGQPSLGGSPTANISPASKGVMPAVGGISSVGQSSLMLVGQPSAGGGGLTTKVPVGTATGALLSGFVPTPVASSVAAPANSPAAPGVIGTAASVLGNALNPLGHK